jgi:arylsulfatase A-like enzyme
MLRTTWIIAVVAGTIGVVTNAAAAPPNVVFILVDDLGYADLGCYGSSFYETPNIDALAADGIRFTDAYAACPVCSPTRASILSGQWPQRVGVTDYIGAPSPAGWKRNTVLLPAAYQDRLDLQTPTLAEALGAEGYATFFAGKWHLGPEGWWPENQGFDVNRGGIDRGGPYGGKKYFSPYGNPRLEDGPDGEHLPDRLAKETCDFIDQHRAEPFFAYLSFYSVHTPLIAREDLKTKYETKRRELGLEAKWGRESTRDVRLVQEHAVYAAMVEAMDQAVGRVIDKLDELGLSEQTLVVLTSDNGGLSTSEGWPTSNLPLRGGKGWMYEGGIREPLIITWKGTIRPGQQSAVPVSSPDFYPTVLEVAGAEPPEGHKLDGTSLVPLFSSAGPVPEMEDRPLYWHYPHYGNQGGAPAAAVRQGEWKLIRWLEDDRRELFNLAQDIGETNDVADDHPEIVERLSEQLADWQSRVGAKFPTRNADYDANKRDGRIADRPGAQGGR